MHSLITLDPLTQWVSQVDVCALTTYYPELVYKTNLSQEDEQPFAN